LLRVSGNHAGLLRASFDLAGQIAFGTPESEALRFLANSEPIQSECQIIWDSLPEIEQATLKELVGQPSASSKDQTVVALLREKYLLTGEADNLQIVPILFREFVRHQTRPDQNRP